MAMQFSPAGQSLGLNNLVGVSGLGDQLESEAERKRRLAQIAQQRQLLSPQASPATASLFGSMTSTGLLR